MMYVGMQFGLTLREEFEDTNLEVMLLNCHIFCTFSIVSFLDRLTSSCCCPGTEVSSISWTQRSVFHSPTWWWKQTMASEAQNSVQCWALENTIMNLRVSQKARNFLNIWTTISFPRRTLFIGAIYTVHVYSLENSYNFMAWNLMGDMKVSIFFLFMFTALG
jgi:hypothetical protein